MGYDEDAVDPDREAAEQAAFEAIGREVDHTVRIEHRSFRTRLDALGIAWWGGAALTVGEPIGIDPAWSDDACAHWMARLVREFYEVHYPGAAVWPLRAARIGPKLYRQLVSTARALQGIALPPAIWLVFSGDVWPRYRPAWSKEGPPQLAWMLSAARVQRAARWAHEHRAGRFQHVLEDPFRKEIAAASRAVETELIRAGARPVGDQEALGWFRARMPADRQTRLLTKSAEWRHRTAREWNERQARGEWIWGPCVGSDGIDWEALR